MNETWKPRVAGILSIIAGTLLLIVGMSLIAVSFLVFAWSMLFPNIIGSIFSILGIVAVVGGIFALVRRGWGLSLAGAICAIPVILGIPAILLLRFSRSEFNPTSRKQKRVFYGSLATILVIVLAQFIGTGSWQNFKLVPGPLTFSPAQLPDAIVGQPYQVTVTISGNKTPIGEIYIFPEKLPAGLNIQYQKFANNAVISGIPQEEGTFKITVEASCLGTNLGGQTGRHNFQILVEPAKPITPPSAQPR